ncbi:cytochrome P450 [Tanacetum coccineum]
MSHPNTPLENDNDSDILICSLRRPKVKPSNSINRVNEITKTIEVGTSLGYDMIGKDDDVNAILPIKESKSNRDDPKFIHSLWGDQNCEFGIQKANGSSGGIIAIRDASLFIKQKIIDNESGFIAIFGKWRNIGMDCLMIVVYAPQVLDSKRSLWNKITSLVNNYNGMSIVLGDFNEVRCEQERMGTIFSKHGASSFNEFINRAELFDIPMSGRKFTSMNKYGTKLSKIDRILVSHHFISKWSNAQVLAL